MNCLVRPILPMHSSFSPDVNLNGTTFEDSTIEVTTTVVNNGLTPVTIGIRYLLDFQIGADDGPFFQAMNPDGPVLTHETEFLNPLFESFRIEDNDRNPNPPTFNVFGTVTGPATVVPPPTPPDLLQYVDWANAFQTAFEYTVDPNLEIASPGDSAVHYFFGHNLASAITLLPEGRVTVSASLFLTLPQPPVPPNGGY